MPSYEERRPRPKRGESLTTSLFLFDFKKFQTMKKKVEKKKTVSKSFFSAITSRKEFKKFRRLSATSFANAKKTSSKNAKDFAKNVPKKGWGFPLLHPALRGSMLWWLRLFFFSLTAFSGARNFPRWMQLLWKTPYQEFLFVLFIMTLITFYLRKISSA